MPLKKIILFIICTFNFGHFSAGSLLATHQTPESSACLSDKLALHLALSPDGKQALAELATIREVWLWDTASGKKLWTYPGNSPQITNLAFSPDGKYFVISELDKATVWDSATFEQIGVFPRPQQARYTDSIFLPDNKYILVSGAGESAQLWEIASQKLIHTFPGSATTYLSPDANYLLVQSQNELSWDLWNIWEGVKLQHSALYA